MKQPLNPVRNALWQARLRRSVRLSLALSEPDVDTLQVEDRLRLVERYLLHHLLPGGPLTLSNAARAQFLVRHAQFALLASPADVAAILQEWPLLKALDPLRWQAGGLAS
jgi:hypothetical protein